LITLFIRRILCRYIIVCVLIIYFIFLLIDFVIILVFSFVIAAVMWLILFTIYFMGTYIIYFVQLRVRVMRRYILFCLLNFGSILCCGKGEGVELKKIKLNWNIVPIYRWLSRGDMTLVLIIIYISIIL